MSNEKAFILTEGFFSKINSLIFGVFFVLCLAAVFISRYLFILPLMAIGLLLLLLPLFRLIRKNPHKNDTLLKLDSKGVLLGRFGHPGVFFAWKDISYIVLFKHSGELYLGVKQFGHEELYISDSTPLIPASFLAKRLRKLIAEYSGNPDLLVDETPSLWQSIFKTDAAAGRVPKKSIPVLADSAVLEGKYPVTSIGNHEDYWSVETDCDDSDDEETEDEETEEEPLRLSSVEEILRIDPTLSDLFKLGKWHFAYREDADSEWTIEDLSDDIDDFDDEAEDDFDEAEDDDDKA